MWGYGESSSGSFLTRGKSLKNDPWVHDKSLQLCPTLCDPMNSSLPVLCPRDSPGKNFGVGCHSLLQGLFLTQGSNSCLLHWQAVFFFFFFFTMSATWEAPRMTQVSTKRPPLRRGPVKHAGTAQLPQLGHGYVGASAFSSPDAKPGCLAHICVTGSPQKEPH